MRLLRTIGRSIGTILLASIVSVGCGDFSPRKPFPCSTAGHCPSGFTCNLASSLCYPNGKAPDAAIDDTAGAADTHGDSPKGTDADTKVNSDGPSMVDETEDARRAEAADAEAAPDTQHDSPIDLPSFDLPPQDLGGDAGKTSNGGACTQNSECQSSYCVDRVCCDKACQGTCLSCKQADTGQSDGICTFVSTGKDPHDQCPTAMPETCGTTGSCDGQGACQKYGSNQVCAIATCTGSIFKPAGTCSGNGACTTGTATDCTQYPCSPASGCAKTCSGDGECLGQSYCSNGTCVAKKTSGQACSDKRECSSGFCVDLVCCNTACNGLCESCASASTGQADGNCQPVRSGTASGTDCAMTGGTCGQDGTCDGNRKCRVAARNTSCGSAACSSSSFTPAPACDGAGVCSPGQTQACAGALICASATACKSACGGDGDCIGQTYCNQGTCVAKKATGQACGDKRECSSGFCADGFCCDGSCDSTCMGCSNALTGQAAGKCALVKAGTAHGGNCTNDGTICGPDGRCDGKGACRVGTQGVVCKGETCLAGTSMHSPMSTCDGRGSCIAMTGDCGRFTCSGDGISCRGNCTVDSECVAAAYCNTVHACVADLPPGSVCTSGTQCTSNSCGGRCCPTAGTSCVCTQPNPQNIVSNASFDTDVSGWEDKDDVTGWQTADAEGCPFSGSAKLGRNPTKCVPVTPGTTYNFGFSYMRPVADEFDPVDCGVRFMDQFGCAGNAVGDAPEVGRSESRGVVPWKTIFTTATTPAGAASALIICTFGSTALVDKFFMTPAPGMY